MTIATKITVTDYHCFETMVADGANPAWVRPDLCKTHSYTFPLEYADDWDYMLTAGITPIFNSRCNVLVQDKHGKAVSYRRLLAQKKGNDYKLGKIIRDLKATH